MRERVNMKGQKFGRLLIIGMANPDKYNRTVWLCQCDCGNMAEVSANHIRRGLATSCGCFRAETTRNRRLRHGHTINYKSSVEFTTWQRIIKRCYSERDIGYKNYGGRGIRVCDRWLSSFDNFFEDMGYRPKGRYSIERVNVNGDYCPENCKWIPRFEEGVNKRSNRYYDYNGVRLTVSQWARELNLKYHTLSGRLSRHSFESMINKFHPSYA